MEEKKVKSRTPGSCSVKLFVLCHSMLQLTQLLHSAYFKSCITTIERRYGFNSMSMGTVSSLHEMGNMVLVVFVSYFGSRVHRPRFIGLGGLIMSCAAASLALPHFLSKPYQYNSVSASGGAWDVCLSPGNSSAPLVCRQGGAGHAFEARTQWLILAAAQVMFGIGSVPIQPFGISYVDDFAEPGNSALYIAILFSISVFGPAFGYLLGGMMLRIYVDVDKTGGGVSLPQDLDPSDPRWVGAWWMGLLVSSGCLALASIPYFFFPRVEVQSKARKTERDSQKDEPKKSADTSLVDFLKRFPRLLLRMLLRPVYMLLVLSQCCFSSSIAGLATFLSKFLEHQYGTTPASSSLLIGAINLPMVAVGVLLGGVVMKRARPSVRTLPWLCLLPLTLSVLLCGPLFFMGCSTQRVAGVNAEYGHAQDRWTNRSLSLCNSNCSCPRNVFNPVCGEDRTEFISPCHAGCTNVTLDPQNHHRVQVYTMCSCVPAAGAGLGSAHPGSCVKSCPHFLLPALFLIAFAGFIASLSHNPIYMMVLRTVSQEEKSFAIGVQFLLIRMLAWLPAPAMFGLAIDYSCVWWKEECGRKVGACGYYDNDILRNRYFGLQVGYKGMAIVLLALAGWKAQHTPGLSLEKEPEAA
ncbi:solute carrier organic anion transporter family member 2A1-like [Hypomesus transpacificus]|uniref:solute carrier organic anion transporter family member 2A1-like n=1 Tax=Hypomesus transpacificus TaxID=137520 RepID=UPI001F07BFBC|nr:solute carrier organic anion transporter family member 2A1-like [Hypomesus transpacificus]